MPRKKRDTRKGRDPKFAETAAPRQHEGPSQSGRLRPPASAPAGGGPSHSSFVGRSTVQGEPQTYGFDLRHWPDGARGLMFVGMAVYLGTAPTPPWSSTAHVTIASRPISLHGFGRDEFLVAALLFFFLSAVWPRRRNDDNVTRLAGATIALASVSYAIMSTRFSHDGLATGTQSVD